MNEIILETELSTNYRVFDLSGDLPFTITFGLCRRSSTTDTSPHTLHLDTENSTLDLPYALSNNLLELNEYDKDGSNQHKIDTSHLSKTENRQNKILSLSSPTERKGPWRDNFTAFEWRVEKGSQLAGLFKPGKKYILKLATKDLNVKRYYSDAFYPIYGMLSQDQEPMRILASKRSGCRAVFTTVTSLPWPPPIKTTLQLKEAEKTLHLVISVANTSTSPITIQTQGRQRYLVLRVPFQIDDLPSSAAAIINPSTTPSYFSFTIHNQTSGQLVNPIPKRSGCAGLTSGNIDLRPKFENLMTLEPGEERSKAVDVREVVKRLGDGVFEVRIRERGVWWREGRREDIVEEEGGRVRREKYSRLIPPLMLGSEDVVVVRVVGGQCVEI